MSLTPMPTEFDPRVPWARQPCDCDTSWIAFGVWLLLPRPRDIDVCAVATGHPPARLDRWCEQHFWRLRAQAFDRLGHKRDEAYIRGQTMTALVDVMRQITLTEAYKLARTTRESSAQVLGPLDLMRVARTATMLEQATMSAPSSPSDYDDVDLTQLPDEDLALIANLLRKGNR